MMKKIGIALTGEIYNIPRPAARQRDWTLTKDNIKTNLIDSFKKNNNVDVYIATYQDARVNDVINFYSPTKTLLLSPEGSHQRFTYIKSMENLLDQDLDFIIASRFDLFFDHEVINFNWDYDKMNYISPEMMGWESLQFVADTLFGFPKKYLQSFINSIINSPEDSMHDIYRHMVADITTENIHFLVSEKQWADHIPNMYRVVRSG
jgi:hypothetical protein